MARITIELKSDLCAGSGESLGNVVDTDMCVDAFGLPVIPGRRIKGCLRQAAETLVEIGEKISIDELFGTGLDEAGALNIGDAELECADELRAWLREAKTPRSIEGLNAPAQVSRLFTTIRGQTKLRDGVADPGSLRYTRVLNHISPMTGENLILVAPVQLNTELEGDLEKCCKALRHMGMHRNRGLGWVKVTYKPDKPDSGNDDNDSDTPKPAPIAATGDAGTVCLSYRVALDANVVLAGTDGELTAIPGRSVIGCMAAEWFRQGGSQAVPDEFKRLFLSGEVIWSDLTPVIGGMRSEPAPLMLASLKDRRYSEECRGYTVPKDLKVSSGDALYGNCLSDVRFNEGGSWRSDKQKSVEGLWAVRASEGWRIAGVETDTQYHHRHKGEIDEMLYSHTSVPAGLIYGGTVTLPKNDQATVERLLCSAELRFGHSRNAQYARCALVPVEEEAPNAGTIHVQKGEPVFVVLASNLLLSSDSQYAVDNGTVRTRLAEALNRWKIEEVGSEARVENACPEGCIDYVQYTTLGGYHAMWHLQKPQVCAVAGGSVFCLTAVAECDLPAEFRLGEYRQEGMGLCRVISFNEMKKSLFIPRTRVDSKYKMSKDETEAQRAFGGALLCFVAAEAVPASAVILAKAQYKNRGEYKGMDDGKLRTMIEEAGDIATLYKSIGNIKTGEKREALKKFADAVIGGKEAESVVRLEKLLCSNSALLAAVQSLDEGSREKFCEENWKRLLSMTLSMYKHGRPGEGASHDGEEGQA